MSSDDSGFDKEAEREKLREKYGDEADDRENTQRMSELLLQGATMTGKHCDQCGDPIFRYDGQEFCPTCQHEAREQAQRQDADAGAQPQRQGTDAQAQPRDAGTDEQSRQRPETAEQAGTDADPATDGETSDDGAAGTDESATDDEPRVEIDDVRVADQHADPSNVRRPPSQADGHRGEEASADRRPETPSDRRGASARGTTDAADAADLATAREALVRKLSDLAHEAEATDDVARARDLLAATREAAEALDALDRANR